VRALAAALLLLALRPSSASAGPPDEEALQAVLGSKHVTSWLATCLSMSPYTTAMTLEILVTTAGKAKLSKARPDALTRETRACALDAVRSLSFPASELRLRLEYTFPRPGILWHRTRLVVLEAVPWPAWKERYLEGRNAVVKGAVLTVLGVHVMAAGLATGLLVAPWAVGLVIGVAGLVVLATGPPHLVIGARLKRQALEMRSGPAPGVQPTAAGPTLVW
jgi:hypothetical protein